MTGDVSLFGDDDPAGIEPPGAIRPKEVQTIPDWQVDQLRKSLDSLGLANMDERRHVVVRLAGRSVASLRDLTWPEARLVVEGLVALAQPASGTQNSMWDDRDEPTWIDRI